MEAERDVAVDGVALGQNEAANVSTSHVDRVHAASSPKKPHPADLISVQQPDPHVSPLPSPSPTTESDEPIAKQLEASIAAAVVPVSTTAQVGENDDNDGHDDEQVETLTPAAATEHAPSTAAPTPPSLPPEQANGLVHVPPAFEAVQPVTVTTPSPPDASTTRELEPVPSTQDSAPAPAKTSTSASDKDRRKERDSQRTRKQLGDYTLTKTLGAGSMGKVKLGVSNVTGEKVAIKVVPRFTSTAAAHRATEKKEQETASAKAGSSSTKPVDAAPLKPTPSTLAKAAAKDASKEVRTMREGSIGLLLHHPYVCGMKSMVLYPHHYYMVFEYINGGQMLDYIISHGRLRERSARKFARQIGSALEYCHANSIVHRDLKIENILISKTGNIKIIDFGLSNLYSPQTLLNTFCGSLYFAAPELLNAKLYTGPEVDVWSFGIVLYVLVCGKVPFDDQSMPALHAKIKRGQVEYPVWLSSECKHLLSRMLVTNPGQRATLTEVLNHPWMTKGYNGPPDSHLPARVPLKPEDIDPEVVKGMVGFEFGTAQENQDKLVDLLQSDLYRQTVRNWEQRANSVDDIDGRERPATRVDGKDLKRSPTSKRFSGLGFYGKKLTANINAAFSNEKKDDDLSNASSATLVNAASRGDVLDPTRGFSPLLSIYFLVREKQERERIYGAGHFASSTVSLTGPPPPPAPMQAYQSGSHVPPQPEPARRPPGRPEPVEIAAPTAARVPLTPQPRQRATGEELGVGHLTAPPANRYQPRSAPATPVIPHASLQRASMHEPRTDNGSDDGGSGTPSSFVRRFGSLLSRSGAADNTGQRSQQQHRHRASVSGTVHRGSTKTPASPLPQVTESHFGGSDVPLPSPADGQAVQRASTVGNMSPSARHNLTAATAAAAQPTAAPASDGDESAAEQLDSRFVETNETANVDRDVGFTRRTASPSFGASPEAAKPVWLKGLFSVSTTTTKPTATIRSDLVRVLDRLGVQYRDVKSGFECVHAPSIDLASLAAPKKGDKVPRRRASKLLLHGGAASKDRDAVDMSRSSLHGAAGTGVGTGGAQPGTSTSWTVLPSNAAATIPHPPVPATTTNTEKANGEGASSELIVRFEIFIVKMPLLPGIHGLQFRRIGGDAWQYQMLARRVLQEMKL